MHGQQNIKKVFKKKRNDVPSIEGYMLTHYRMTDELERIWKEAVVA